MTSPTANIFSLFQGLLILAGGTSLVSAVSCTRSPTTPSADMYVINMYKEDTVEVTVGNATCPVSGKPVAGKPEAPSFSSIFKGHKMGFMCPVCKGTFDQADEAAKLEYLQKALKISGKPPLPTSR